MILSRYFHDIDVTLVDARTHGQNMKIVLEFWKQNSQSKENQIVFPTNFAILTKKIGRSISDTRSTSPASVGAEGKRNKEIVYCWIEATAQTVIKSELRQQNRLAGGKKVNRDSSSDSCLPLRIWRILLSAGTPHPPFSSWFNLLG